MDLGYKKGVDVDMLYRISAELIYCDTIEADTENEAIDMFCDYCPYEVDADTIYIERVDDDGCIIS